MATSNSLELAAIIFIAGVATYLWRGLGVWIADRVDLQSPFFQWVTAVAYAMLAGLICRMVILPMGLLTESALWMRLVGVAIGVAVFFATGRHLAAGILIGALSLPALQSIFAA